MKNCLEKNLLLLVIICMFIITCKKTPEPEAPKEKTFIVPKKNYLSREWVSYKQTIVNGENISASTREQLQSKAYAKIQKGIRFYKAKKYLEAIQEYEEAIEFYPLTELYYHYGNSLANLNRLEDSILAYQISLSISDWQYRDELNRPELVMYNLACSYSRLNQLDEAYSYLAKAVDRGYNAFAYVEKDPDMENPRKHPDWKAKIQKWRQEYSYDETAVAGVIKDMGPRDAILYYLCKNGVAIQAGINYCPGHEKGTVGYYKGIWRLVKGDIKVDIQESCFPSYVISKKEKEKYNYEHQGAASYCPPGIPEFKGNCEVKIRNVHNRNLIWREVVKDIIKGESTYSKNETYTGEFSFKKLRENQEPKQCDPDFVPKTLKDITIKEIQ